MFIKKCKERSVPVEPKFYVCTIHKIYNDTDSIKVGPKVIGYICGFTAVCYKLRPEEYKNLQQYF